MKSFDEAELIQEKIKELIDSNYIPNFIFFHGGNGLGVFLKSILPTSILIGYFEWYFSKSSAELILNRKDQDAYNFIRARNMSMESEIIDCDACVVPTNGKPHNSQRNLVSQYLSII